MKYKLIVLFWLATVLCVHGQINQLYTFDLPVETVPKCLIQTSNQKVWLATSNGLYYLAEKTFEKFEENLLSKENLSALAEDSSRNVWIGCESGNIYLLSSVGSLSKWAPPEGTPKQGISAIRVDLEGKIWIGTKGEGLFLFDQQYVYNYDKHDGLNDNSIYDIEIDGDNQVWLATDQGINICSFKNRVKKVKTIGRTQGLSDEIVKCLRLNTAKTAIYVGYHEAGVDKINTKTMAVTQVLRRENLLDLDQLQIDGNLLVLSTIRNGVFSYEEGHTNTFRQVFASNHVHSIFTDRQSNTWVATSDKGLVRSNLNYIKYDLGTDIMIQAIAGEYIGTNQGLFQMQSENGKPVKVAKQSVNVVSLKFDTEDRLWVGTFGQGLYRYRLKKGLQKVVLPDENVLSIERYDQGVLVATLAGIFYVTEQEGLLSVKDFNQMISLPKYYVYKLFLDSKGILWIGTGGKGLIQYDGISWKSINHIDQKEIKTVFAICEDRQGQLWFGIDKVGLANFGQGKFRLVTGHGLRCQQINDIQCGASGNLLIVHALGIDLYQPSSGQVTYFEPFLNNYRIDHNINTGYYGQNKFCLGSFSNVYLVNDKKIIDPTINLDYLEVNGEKLAPTRSTFDHLQNNIHFNLSTSFLDQSQEQLFEYKLEGYDGRWKSSHVSDLEYQNLRSGQYVFKVRSKYGARTSPLLSFSFQIKDPFWKRPWFLILSAVLAGAFFYYWLQLRDVRKLRELKRQRESIENQLDVLKSHINPHFLFNSFNSLIAVIETDPKVAVEFVTKLSDFYRKVMLYREKAVIPIQEELALISDFAYLIDKRFADNIRIVLQITRFDGYVVPFGIQMLVENAVKHNVASKEKPLIVTVASEGAYYVVRNNLQLKKIKEASTNFGLDFIVKHYEFLDSKKVEIVQDETSFIVKLPILKHESPTH